MILDINPDTVEVSARNLRKAGVRTFLTLIGVIIGIAAIVSLLSIGSGLTVAVQKQFEELGSNTIFVIPGSAAQQGFAGVKLTDADISKIESIKGVDEAVPIYSRASVFQFGSEKVGVQVNAVDAKKSSIFDNSGFLSISEGRMLEKNDSDGILIGNSIAKDLFDREVHTKKRILLDGVEYEVVGILKPQQQSFGGGPNTGGTVYMSLEAYKRIVGNVEINPSIIFVKTFTAGDVKDSSDEIQKYFDRKYGDKSVRVSAAEQILEQINSFLNLITIFVVGVGGISLVVGGIGIMNAMITSVMERTKEIGVMKALGASNTKILTIILLESAFIGGIGGIIGIIVGYLLATIIAFVGTLAGFALVAYLGLDITLGALFFSMLVGMASGLLPALRAAGLDPVEALRYE